MGEALEGDSSGPYVQLIRVRSGTLTCTFVHGTHFQHPKDVEYGVEAPHSSALIQLVHDRLFTAICVTAGRPRLRSAVVVCCVSDSCRFEVQNKASGNDHRKCSR